MCKTFLVTPFWRVERQLFPLSCFKLSIFLKLVFGFGLSELLENLSSSTPTFVSLITPLLKSFLISLVLFCLLYLYEQWEARYQPSSSTPLMYPPSLPWCLPVRLFSSFWKIQSDEINRTGGYTRATTFFKFHPSTSERWNKVMNIKKFWYLSPYLMTLAHEKY